MRTTVVIDGTDFLINAKPTYPGREFRGQRVEGLLLNSRMVQAIFDDECPETRPCWAYPDTGAWDPDRNVSEFIAALPDYRRHGLLAVTVGLQGGGSVYTSPVYERYLNSAFTPAGNLKPAYFERLRRVLEAADRLGMVVIVNYLYWRQERFESDAACCRAVENATAWLLQTGYLNLLVDLKNEIMPGDGLTQSGGIHRLLQIARSTTLAGRRLLIGASVHPHNHLPPGDWSDHVDFLMPHGNDSDPDQWRKDLRLLKQSDPYRRTPMPILCNEDSVDIRNLDVSLEEGCSWGYYDQGFGCGQKQGKLDWSTQHREKTFSALSGFQTVPINWTINTPHKRAFFNRVLEVTGGS